MIVFAHLLNDYSGSPRILSLAIKSLRSRAGHSEAMQLFVGSGHDGCLNSAGIPIYRYWYKRGRSRLVTLVNYLASQCLLFLKLAASRRVDRDAIVYVNTLLPFGAALYGWITRRVVIYHVHEISITPRPLRWFLVTIARLTSSLNIYVSRAHSEALVIRGVPFKIVYNALDESMARKGTSTVYEPRRDGLFNVLMVSSLRDYKGVPELIRLCERLSAREDIRFHLLVSEDTEGIERYFKSVRIPKNLTVHPCVPDPSPFYEKASLVLNLSRPDLWVETFGLTILEALTFGVPAIVPPVGGPSELVRDGIEGFLVDSRDGGALETSVLKLANDESLCRRMSFACRERADGFSEQAFGTQLCEVLREAAAR